LTAQDPTLDSKQSLLSRITGVLTLGWSDGPSGRLRLRRMVSRSARLALRARSRPFPGNLFKSVAVVAPHPDDETLGCGGTLAILASGRAAVHVVFVTDGGASHPSHPRFAASEIARMRRAEAKEATGTLGVDWDRVLFVDAPDGGLASLDSASSDAVASRIAEIFAEIAPDAVLLPLRRDGSSDHDASFILVQLALKKAGRRPRIFEFPIWAWRNPLLQIGPILASRAIWRIDIKDVLDRKAAALGAYASQIRPIAPDTRPVLSQEFMSEFSLPEEFLFER
jgi:LmbE family N-acetylglucosaminyl deacetylase